MRRFPRRHHWNASVAILWEVAESQRLDFLKWKTPSIFVEENKFFKVYRWPLVMEEHRKVTIGKSCLVFLFLGKFLGKSTRDQDLSFLLRENVVHKYVVLALFLLLIAIFICGNNYVLVLVFISNYEARLCNITTSPTDKVSVRGPNKGRFTWGAPKWVFFNMNDFIH